MGGENCRRWLQLRLRGSLRRAQHPAPPEQGGKGEAPGGVRAEEQRGLVLHFPGCEENTSPSEKAASNMASGRVQNIAFKRGLANRPEDSHRGCPLHGAEEQAHPQCPRGHQNPRGTNWGALKSPRLGTKH